MAGCDISDELVPEHAPANTDVLDNPVWWSLVGAQNHLAESIGTARRYRADVSVFSAVDELDERAWFDLARLVGPAGDVGLLRADAPSPPDRWVGVLRGRGHQMLLGPDGLSDVDRFDFRPLGTDDIPAMLALVDRTIPGPFLARTIEVGRYYGHFDGDRLVAMAGERFRPDGWTEVSAVCTHPDLRSRGLGSAITHHVASGILERGERPFLHVAETNDTAYRVYERLGWVARRMIDFMVVRAPD